MTSTSSGAAGAGPSRIVVGPNQQAVFLMDYDPRTVSVSNTANFDGAFVFVWIYPSTTAVTPQLVPIPSQAAQTLRPPPPDGNGNQPKTLVIFNIGGATLACQERGD